MTESPIFVVGCPRSGTSLLRDLLRSHRRLAFDHESHFIPAFYRAFGDPRSDREARRLAARVLRLSWVRRWDLGLDAASLAHCRSYRELVSALYRELARRQRKPRWGDKTPHYATEIPMLLELFPAARVIHIYRDGRDVALSWMATSFGPSNVLTAATAWKRLATAGRRGVRAQPDSCLEVRYETLVAQPKPTMRRVCDFIGEDYTEAVLRPSPLPRFPYRPIVGAWPQRVRPSDAGIAIASSGRWRRDMTPGDRSVFEGVAGELLAELGYEIDGAPRALSRGGRLACRAHSRARRAARRVTNRDLSPATVLFTHEARIRGWLSRRGRADSCSG